LGDARGQQVEDLEGERVARQRDADLLETGRFARLRGFGRGRGIALRVGGVVDGVGGGFEAVAPTTALVAQYLANRPRQVDPQLRAFGGVPRGPALEEVTDGGMDRIHCIERRCAMRERALLELRRQLIPVGAGNGFALRLAETLVR
jgi:hypothetical protein